MATYSIVNYQWRPVIKVEGEWIDYWGQQQKRLYVKQCCYLYHSGFKLAIQSQATYPDKDAALAHYEKIASQFLLNL